MTASLEKPKTPSLYELTLETQEIDGELAIALDLAASDDPEEQQQAEELISALLQRSAGTSQLVLQKANAICHIREGLLGKAEYLRKSAAERIVKAEAEEKAAERITTYLTRCLSAMHPGQKSFKLPEYTVSSRASEAVEVDELRVPKHCCRFEVKVNIAAGYEDIASDIAQLCQEVIESRIGNPVEAAGIATVSIKSTPDKSVVKGAIKSGIPIPGGRLNRRTSWSIK